MASLTFKTSLLPGDQLTRFLVQQVCKEEEEAIKVELHEGCGRTKLFWLLALADPRTLKAMVEYREGGARTRGSVTNGVCRFCGATGNSGLLAIGNVCADHECQVGICSPIDKAILKKLGCLTINIIPQNPSNHTQSPIKPA